MQQLEGESLGAICYGLGPFDGSLSEAQQRFLQTLGTDIASNIDGRVVLAGVSLGTLIAELAEKRISAVFKLLDTEGKGELDVLPLL